MIIEEKEIFEKDDDKLPVIAHTIVQVGTSGIDFYTFGHIVMGLLSFTILMQESKSMGLGASFGGDVSDSLFGTSTAVVLKKFTAYLVVIFMASCILLSIWTSALGRPKKGTLPAEIEEVQE